MVVGEADRQIDCRRRFAIVCRGLKMAIDRQPCLSMRCNTCVRSIRNAVAAASAERGIQDAILLQHSADGVNTGTSVSKRSERRRVRGLRDLRLQTSGGVRSPSGACVDCESKRSTRARSKAWRILSIPYTPNRCKRLSQTTSNGRTKKCTLNNDQDPPRTATPLPHVNRGSLRVCAACCPWQ